jgi:tetratricopeptide (TPR) repeat protein
MIMSPVKKLAPYLIMFLAVTPALGQSFESWSAKAQKAAKKGENDVAAEYWSNALRAWAAKDGKPKRAKALSERAALYQKLGEADGALADLNSAITLDPKSAAMFDRRGQLLTAENKLAEAISDFYSATKLNIGFSAAYYHRALAYEAQGDAGFAKEDFNHACSLGIQEACERVGKGKKAKPQAVTKAKPKAKPKTKAPAETDEKAPPATEGATAQSAEPDEEPGDDEDAESAPKKKKKAKPPVDFQACIDGLQACSDDGSAIDACVKQAKPCESDSAKGCCPQACVTQFQRGANAGLSDAELFRQVFTPKSACLRPKPK